VPGIIQDAFNNEENHYILDELVPSLNSQGKIVVPEFLKQLFAALGAEVLTYLKANEAEFLAVAAKAGTTGSTALKAYIAKVVASDAFLAPFAPMIEQAVDVALPGLIAKAGGDEQVLYAAVLAYLTKEISYI
jgi:hypothetical protein